MKKNQNVSVPYYIETAQNAKEYACHVARKNVKKVCLILLERLNPSYYCISIIVQVCFLFEGGGKFKSYTSQ